MIKRTKKVNTNEAGIHPTSIQPFEDSRTDEHNVDFPSPCHWFWPLTFATAREASFRRGERIKDKTSLCVQAAEHFSNLHASPAIAIMTQFLPPNSHRPWQQSAPASHPARHANQKTGSDRVVLLYVVPCCRWRRTLTYDARVGVPNPTELKGERGHGNSVPVLLSLELFPAINLCIYMPAIATFTTRASDT